MARSRASGTAAARPRSASALAPTPASISLVLIGGNRLLREGLAVLIQAQPGFKVLAASADVSDALAKVREARPTVVLLDFGLDDHDSLTLTATVHEELPSTKVILMGLLPLQTNIASYVRAGASGFIMKDATFAEFFGTIRAVADGAEVLPPALTNSLFTQIADNKARTGAGVSLDLDRLTGREREVIALLGEGLSNKEIAVRLQVAIHTVKSHVHNVLEKLGLRSRLEVAAFAHTAGRSRPPER
jgi:DNA-binding NarL/FixJ family response regulator